MQSRHPNTITGRIAGVNLSSFLQMIEMERKTCTLNVFANKTLGRIFFHNGSIVDADSPGLRSHDALYDILSWHNFVIEVDPNPERRENQINLPMMHIIMESARRMDEAAGSTIGSAGGSTSGAPEAGQVRQIPLQTLKSREFCLEIGIRLLIDFEELQVTFRSTLVGIEHGKYLLLKSPSPFEDMVHRDSSAPTGELIVKSLYKGTIYAFRSRLMAVITRPSRLMFIQYPDSIEHHELRSHKRFKCSIVAQTRVGREERGGVIENISLGGCLCTIETRASDQDLRADLLNRTLPFRCRFPGSSKQVRFQGAVRNTRQSSDELAVGLAFVYTDNTEETRQMISDYIRLIQYSSESV